MLTDIVNQLKTTITRLQDCDIEIDNEDLEVSEFSYSDSWGVSVSIKSPVEVEYVNGVRANKWLVIEEEVFDNIIDELETKLARMSNLDRAIHIIDDIDRATKNLRTVLGADNADNS